MGIADRDYSRSPSRGGRGAGRTLGMLGGVTGALILINVAVFVLSNLVLRPGPIDYGTVIFPGVTEEQVARGQVVPAPAPGPAGAGWERYPIVDPQSAELTRDGRVVINPRTGAPVPRQIGYRRVAAMTWPKAWGHFSTARVFRAEVWRFVTFQFLHFDLVHLGFNMLGLLVFGRLVEEYLGPKRYAAFYLVCGIFGAVAYLVLNLAGFIVDDVLGLGQVRIPGLLFYDIYTPLVGASAGVFGVIVACAFVSPTDRVQLIFPPISLSMRTFAYGYVLIAAGSLLLGGANQGGQAAHLGGAAAGYFFIRRTHLLRDFFDVLGDSRAPGRGGRAVGRRSKPSPARAGAGAGSSAAAGGGASAADAVLEKVRRVGVGGLTEAEREILRQASERLGGRGGSGESAPPPAPESPGGRADA